MNYPAHKLEFLLLKWAVTKKFQDYLYGKKFAVITDNNPLTDVLTSAKLDATGHRWVAALAAFDFEIHYRSGRNNTDADSLSRLPESQQQNRIPISLDSVKTIASISTVQTPSPLVESLSIDSDALQPLVQLTCQQINQFDVKREQRQEPLIKELIYFVENDSCPEQHELPRVAYFLRRTSADLE